MVVPAIILAGQAALRIDRPAELSAPDDQRIIEHAALLEVLNQGGRAAVGVVALVPEGGGQVAVLVPAAMQDLDDAHASFDQPARQQGAVGEGARLAHRRAVHIQNALRFAGNVDQFRHAGLHAKRHFVLGDARLRLRIAEPFEVALVELRRERRAWSGGPDR